MTRHTRIVTPFFAVAAAVLSAGLSTAACRSRTEQAADTPGRPTRGGTVVASIRTEPRSFNRLAARDSSSDLVSTLINAKLIRINRSTQDVEPWLAEKWTAASDGRHYTLTLRDGLRFSDGHRFSADDVVFTFAAVYDPRAQATLADAVKVAGKPLVVTAVDPRTVAIEFPSVYAPGLRLLANLPILPKHKLEGALKGGTLASAWGLSTPLVELTGLGPFVLKEYAPGQRLVFDRNPNYWRKDANGATLPYLDRLTVEIVPDQNAEQLRLQAGQVDIPATEVPPESYASIKRAADEHRVQLFDLGVGLGADSFWINLKPGAFGGDSRAAWLQRDEFRRAISMAVDRRLFADTVFFGAGEPVDGPETPANKLWYSPDVPRTPHDPDGAKKLLGSIGLLDRNGDGQLEDAGNRPVTFTAITQKGRPKLERGLSVVRDELKKIGITMEVAALDGNAVIERILSARYDAVYFSPQSTDTDPGTNPDFWFSSGAAHFWNPGQPKPATAWEARVDQLMTAQIASLDPAERRRLFTDVLRIFAEHQPVLYFAAPKIFVAVSSRVSVTPALDFFPVLWSPDTVAVAPSASTPTGPTGATR